MSPPKESKNECGFYFITLHEGVAILTIGIYVYIHVQCIYNNIQCIYNMRIIFVRFQFYLHNHHACINNRL